MTYTAVTHEADSLVYSSSGRLLLEGCIIETLIVLISCHSSDEQTIMRQNLGGHFPEIIPVISTEQILRARETVNEVYMDEKIERYILDIIFYHS